MVKVRGGTLPGAVPMITLVLLLVASHTVACWSRDELLLVLHQADRHVRIETSISSLSEVVDTVQFGSCGVGTDKDDFTDEVKYHTVACWNRDEIGTYIGVTCAKEAVLVSFTVPGLSIPVPGLVGAVGSKVEIKYRFDEEPFIGEGLGRVDQGFLPGRARFDEVLEGISRAETVVFQVDEKTRRIALPLEAEAATEELKSRCSTL